MLELAIIRCGVDDSGSLCSIDEMLDEFNHPGFEIPPKVGELTGITDEMVRGKSVDKAKVERILRGDPVIIAHNARFDCPFFEKIFLDDCHKWACSMQYCDWPGREFSGGGGSRRSAAAGGVFLRRPPRLHGLPSGGRAAACRAGQPRGDPRAAGKGGSRRELVRRQGDTEGAQVQVGRRQQDLAQGGAGGPDAKREMEFLKDLYPDGYRSTCLEIDRRKEFKAAV